MKNYMVITLNSYEDYLEALKSFPNMQNGTPLFWSGSSETALFGHIGVKGVSRRYYCNW
ncbi:hypothetical protein [Clostridium sp. DSM 8431]|uniref:hypothetical protein n=1 Tax=Clostridium sp. DSM 8431 TaxID=1761781 RepID=UPI001A9A5EC1|nr:hypothetical protein [Clostridium sp. DSM 8431]